MRQVPDAAVTFVAAHEGCKLESYLCPAQTWTIGYGSTRGVHGGMRITEADARKRLAEDLKEAAARLAGVVKREVLDSLTENQYSALLSFVFNLGAGSNWEIWRRLNARQYEAVPGEMLRFVNCNGKRLQGLADRRSAEVALWRTGEPGTEADDPPSSFTRAEETPPVEAPKPAGAKLTAISAGAITTLAAVQGGAQQVQSMVAPQADKSPWLGKLLSLTAVLIVAAGVAILALHWLQSKAAKR